MFFALFFFALAAVRRMSERDNNREVFTNDVFEVAGRRDAPIGVDVERFFGRVHVVLVVCVVTSRRHVIGNVVLELAPNGETFRSPSSSRLVLSTISSVIVHGPHVRVCILLLLFNISEEGTEKFSNVATVAWEKKPSANMASQAGRVKNTFVSRFTGSHEMILSGSLPRCFDGDDRTAVIFFTICPTDSSLKPFVPNLWQNSLSRFLSRKTTGCA